MADLEAMGGFEWEPPNIYSYVLDETKAKTIEMLTQKIEVI